MSTKHSNARTIIMVAIAEGLIDGLSNEQIADQLGRNISTVEYYRTHIPGVKGRHTPERRAAAERFVHSKRSASVRRRSQKGRQKPCGRYLTGQRRYCGAPTNSTYCLEHQAELLSLGAVSCNGSTERMGLA